MDLILLILGTCLQFGHVVGTSDLDAVLRRLDEMDAKFAKVDALLTGFDQLCQSINQLKTTNVDKNSEILEQCRGEYSENCARNGETVANGNGNNVADYADDVANGIENDDAKTKSDDKLEIVSVASEGLNGGIVPLNVVYIADQTCLSEWFITGKDLSETRLGGEIRRQANIGERIQFVSTIKLPYSVGLQFVLFMINCKFYTANLSFNMSVVKIQGENIIPPLQYDILDFPRHVAILDSTLRTEGFKTSITVTDNVVKRLNWGEFLYDILLDMFNSTSTPPVLTTIWRQDNFSVTANDEVDNQVDIAVANELSQFGGVLTIRLHQDASHYDYLKAFLWGVKIQFVNEAIGGLMPYGTFGLYQDESTVLVQGQSFNALCMAFGVPIPRVTMQNKGDSDQIEALQPDVEGVIEPYTYKVVNFKDSKTITCTASNGIVTQSHTTRYIKVTWAEIDEKKTRLVKNTTDKVTVICKAMGNPVPDIRILTNDANKRNLLEEERFEHKVTQRKFAIKVTLTMAPPDQDIRSVLCVAQQTIEMNIKVDTREIKIFPPKFGADPMNNYTVFEFDASDLEDYN